ncbi:MAG: AAA family ATPase [Coxiella sp. (in: Bacteria)]|nr:MAG: AAA family ATPase [Coxiella sp. (in: g-proteobacteria)]
MPELLESSRSYPIVTILGPRQSGKTTLAKLTFPGKAYVSLEAPDERQFAITDPRRFLERFAEGAILDEIQRTPELLSYLQTIVDEQNQNGRFVLTGSHQLELQQSITQSLAGRTGMLHLYPLSLSELKTISNQFSLDEQMMHGGYPRIYEHHITPLRFYRDYTQTYLERDLKQITQVKDLDQFQRFLYLCAARVGCLIDYTSLANELGISRHTIKHWISVLKASFIITTLPPYFENFGKQIIKSSKLYFTDVGLLCYLLGIQETIQLERHPLRGEIFENLVLLELIKNDVNRGIEPRLFFYRDSQQNEVDIIKPKGNDLIAIEIKSSQTFNKGFLKPMGKFKALAKNRKVQGVIIYSGQQEQMINDVQLLNYQHTKKIDAL